VPFLFCIITRDFCRFILLVLQSARVEVAVLLNELAFLKYESSKSSQTDDAISQKQRNLAILFSLIERIIEMISYASSREGMYTLSWTIFGSMGWSIFVIYYCFLSVNTSKSARGMHISTILKSKKS
jgi:hypothetical protein